MKLIATKPMRYGTRRLQAGDEFDAKHSRMARVFVAAGLAREAPDVPKPAAQAKPAPVVEPKPAMPAAVNIDDLREEAEALGILVDGRWGVTRLQQEIAQAKL